MNHGSPSHDGEHPPAIGSGAVGDPPPHSAALSNPGKILFPDGFTKGQMVEYYAAIAPVLLPHLRGRALTLRRFPDGVGGPSFYEKRCPRGSPPWVPTVEVSSRSDPAGSYRACSADDARTLAWLANLAAVELHPSLSLAAAPEHPTVLVFDLDPGPPAGVVECAEVACLLREVLGGVGLKAFPKTSGSKGLQVYVPLDPIHSYAVTKPLARSIAVLLEQAHPQLVVSVMTKSLRRGRVLIDWSQNSRTKTTVAAYSLRARATPGVSAPLHWYEVEALAARREAPASAPDPLLLTPQQVLRRVAHEGDVFAPVATLRQHLAPELVALVRDLA